MSALAPRGQLARVAAPMPLVAPVTTATRPAIPRSMRDSSAYRRAARSAERPVAAAEQDRVDEQREQLVERDAVLVAAASGATSS